MKRFNKKGFTLIELLVVISIISLLSSIVIASLNEARDKARIAKALQFDAHIKNALGSEIIEEWNFDGSINDITGNGNTVFNISGSPTYITSIRGQGLNLNGSTWIGVDDYPSKTKLGDHDSYAVSLWFKTSIKNNNQTITDRWASGGKYAWEILGPQNDGRIKFSIWDGSTMVSIYSKTDLADNKFHHLLIEKDLQDDVIRLYIDGELHSTGQDTTTGNLYSASSLMYIGGVGSGDFQGIIDEVRVYHSGL
jgi:prepilin-type N-terminal cleavage/methylation domain-containing protein